VAPGQRLTWSQARTAIVECFVRLVLCLICLIFLPFHAWALALLVGLSALAVTLIGRPGDAVTAGGHNAVVLVVAALGPHDAWRQPILRLAGTIVGVAVGVVAAWAGLRLIRPRLVGRQ
jgi:hypothetical protein